MGTNPFNGLDTRTLLDNTDTNYFSGTYRSRSVSWACANGNSTNVRTYAAATITVGGMGYSTNAEDIEAFAPCGW